MNSKYTGLNNLWNYDSSSSLKYENTMLNNEIKKLKKKNSLLEKEKKILEQRLLLKEQQQKINHIDNFDLNHIICVVCQSNLKSVCYVKCKHLTSCLECDKLLDETCPICRQPSQRMSLYI